MVCFSVSGEASIWFVVVQKECCQITDGIFNCTRDQWFRVSWNTRFSPADRDHKGSNHTDFLSLCKPSIIGVLCTTHCFQPGNLSLPRSCLIFVGLVCDCVVVLDFSSDEIIHVATHMTSQIRYKYNNQRLYTTDSESIVQTSIVHRTGLHAECARRITTNYVQ